MEETDEASLGGFVQSFQYAISVVKHFGHILVTSGVFLIILSGWTWTTSWVVLTIVGMGSSVFYLARAFKPTLKTYGTSDFNKESFIAKLRKSTWIYILLLLFVLWLMVAKPVLW
ncbi:hypothetical protein [Ureibacillus xyleni]|nr:hypothetical protein [Ureibacillus xyleni]